MVLHDVAGSKCFDHAALDSFVVYIALNGSVRIVADGVAETLEEGEVILIPAEVSEVVAEGNAKLMEVYIAR
jgi:mannose-6-phosphate isomerase